MGFQGREQPGVIRSGDREIGTDSSGPRVSWRAKHACGFPEDPAEGVLPAAPTDYQDVHFWRGSLKLLANAEAARLAASTTSEATSRASLA
jgi:hypothetical protein